MSTQLITAKIKTYAGTSNGINGNHATVAYYNALTEGSHNNSIDNLLTGVKWGPALGQGASLLVSISNSHSTYNGGLGNLKNFSTTQIDAIHNAMQAWQNIANITFTQITDSATNAGDIRWANSNSSSASTGYTYYPSASSNGSAGDIYMGVNVPTPTIGAWAYLTYMHELAHALGFLHPHDSSASVPAKAGEDQVKYTVMSYKDFAGDSSGYNADYYPTTPMLNDISAMQFLYGANINYHRGDDNYTWAVNQKVFETLWDAAGNDTLDASNQARGVLLNLNSGQWSQIGVAFSNSKITVRDCLTIAYGAVIENAIGSAFADTLIGNTAANSLTGGAGNDTLQANTGNDTLNGGAGNDNYSINLGDGIDTISDNSGNDTVLFGAGINSAQITASLNNNQIKLTINAQNSVQLSDVLSIEQFNFADGTTLNSNWLSNLLNIASNNHSPALTGTVINLINGTEDTNYTFTAAQLLSAWTDSDNDTLTLSNISVNHGTLTNTAANYTFTPTSNYNGLITINYAVNDGHGASINTNRTFRLTNVNDAPTGAVMIDNTNPQIGNILTVSNSLADADGLGVIQYQWQVNGINTAVGNSYTVNSTDLGKTIKVIAKYTDLAGTKESVTSLNTSAVLATTNNSNVLSKELFENSLKNWLIESFPDVNSSFTTIKNYVPSLIKQTLSISDPDSGSFYFSVGNIDTVASYYNGQLSYQVADVGSGAAFNIPLVIVSGGGIHLSYIDNSLLSPSGAAFTTYAIPLKVDSHWQVMSGVKVDQLTILRQATITDFITAFSNNTRIALRGEFISGIDTAYLAKASLLSANLATTSMTLNGDLNANILNGGSGHDTLTANAGNDILNGHAGKDVLNGGSGNDILNGGAGNDRLTGGVGKDSFQLNTLSQDTIKDFSVSDDTIQLENNVLINLTATGVLNNHYFKIASVASDNNDYIIYNNTTGGLFYDADGNGINAPVQIALLSLHLALTNADFVVI